MGSSATGPGPTTGPAGATVTGKPGSGPDVPVVLAGVHGHGHNHLANLERLAATGSAVRLAGICDPLPPTPDLRERLSGVPWEEDLGTLIDRVGARVAIICTPIHTHARLALTAAGKGCGILLEKPPTPTLASFARLTDGLREFGASCQVGFQDLASPAIDHVRELISAGAVGRIHGIGVTGTWIRDSGYFTRSPWAGRRTLRGEPVTDGVLSNPFAHAIASTLLLDGSDGRVPPEDIEVELYRANDIESDDTSCVRLRTARGTTVLVAATLCAERSRDPVITVRGTHGRIDLLYKQGRVRLRVGDPVRGTAAADAANRTPIDRVRDFARADLLENLVGHVLDRSRELLVPLESTAAFMHVLEAIRTAPGPVPVPAEFVRTVDTPTGTQRVLPGIDAIVAEAAGTLALFSELGPGWARPREVSR